MKGIVKIAVGSLLCSCWKGEGGGGGGGGGRGWGEEYALTRARTRESACERALACTRERVFEWPLCIHIYQKRE